MKCENNCGKCCGRMNCCGAGCGKALCLTPGEVNVLRQLAEIPFLPIARHADSEDPVFLETQGTTNAENSQSLLWLQWKGLVSLDYDMPLSGFDYSAYDAYPVHGSIALTAAGQEVVEILEIQGAVIPSARLPFQKKRLNLPGFSDIMKREIFWYLIGKGFS